MSELFDAVDALVASRAKLPPPAERKRLRFAHGLTIDEVAGALKVRRATVSGWESGKTEPRPPERDAYARLLDRLAELYPALPGMDTAAETLPAQDAPVPATFTAAPAPAEPLSTEQSSGAAGVSAPVKPQVPAEALADAPAAAPGSITGSSASRRPGARKASAVGTPAGGADPRFENGPLAVVDAGDGEVVAYCVGGLVLDVPAKSLPSLVEWTLKE
ncbi:helix-turn-helix transcriptional regulator, partial [Streptomyces globisporus]